MLDPALLAPERLRRFTRAEYDRLVDLGFFVGERLELLHGTLVTMSPINPAHAMPVGRLDKLLHRDLGDRADVRVQQPLIACDESEPEPDLAVVSPGDGEVEHPSRPLLVIEVAVSSLDYDRGIKARLYAASGFPEYWIVDVEGKAFEVYRAPVDGGYTLVTRHGAGDIIHPLAFPDVAIAVADVVR